MLTGSILIPATISTGLIGKPIFDTISTVVELIMNKKTSWMYTKLNIAMDEHDDLLSNPTFK